MDEVRISGNAHGCSPEQVEHWHAQSSGFVLDAFQSAAEGLSPDDAKRRLERYGLNRLSVVQPRSVVERFLAQFKNVLIYVLLAAAAVTLALGHTVDALVILLVVMVNAVIGFVQEGRAERALESIRAMISRQASVIRDGRRLTVPAEEVVPGDIVFLEAGDRVPADLRLVRARGLRIDESMLTGESVPAEKAVGPVSPEAALGDRACMAFSGTLVASGQGFGVVVATAQSTELGRISALLGEVEHLTTPLVQQMNRFARVLTATILGVSAGVFALAIAIHQTPWRDAFMAVVGLAVAAIPEGLPAVMTITLAIGVRRMATRNAIIRRLPAVETLGSVSVICSDKTGTLTRNEMIVSAVITADGRFEVTGSGYEPRGEFLAGGVVLRPLDHSTLLDAIQGASLCNDANIRETENKWNIDGDPMEGALLALSMKADLDPGVLRRRFPRLDEIPFDPQHRYMATLHPAPDHGRMIFVKGAPERVIAMCAHQRTASGDAIVMASWWLEKADHAAAAGQRVIGIAAKRLADTSVDRLVSDDAEQGLTMLGLLCLIDPPRDEARAAVSECQSAGIRVKMITGDHAVTAAAIAKSLGVNGMDARVVTGNALDRMPEGEFRNLIRSAAVFARTSPEHKMRIVRALQADGEVVVMTGDGVNDAPSLKQADVGVAMGRKGTEAAKEAAEMVLADDNFASIVAAVHEGRTVYDNLKKVIAWTLPTNGGEALTIIAAMLLGLTLPITPAQILWVNMITAATLGLTLAFEPPEPDVMKRPPRARDEPVLSVFLVWRVALVSVLFLASSFGMFAWATGRGLPVEEARTIVVNTMVVLEIFYLFSVRSLHGASITWRGVMGTGPVLIGVGAVTLAQFAFTYLGPMQALFHSRPLSLVEGAAIIANGLALLFLLEAEKRVWRFVKPRRAAG